MHIEINYQKVSALSKSNVYSPHNDSPATRSSAASLPSEDERLCALQPWSRWQTTSSMKPSGSCQNMA
jgi:hypothetical protein